VIPRLWAIALAATALVAFPAAASAQVLLDQSTAGSGPPTPPLSSYDVSGDTASAQAADDFTVPAGKVWRIDSVVAIGAGAIMNPSTNLFIYPNSGSLPGAPAVFSQLGVAASGQTDLTVPVTGGAAIPAGMYWLSVQTAGSSWFWTADSAEHGSPAAWRNPSGVVGPACTTQFKPFNDCAGVPGSKSLLFRINGTEADAPTAPVTPPQPAQQCTKKKKHHGKKRADAAKKHKKKSCKRKKHHKKH
jgi:hypothetical protein